MRVLILGLSNIAQRRVVPALRTLRHVGGIDVATRKAAGGQTVEWTYGDVFDDYQAGIDRTSATVVYISLVNSEHARWAEAALRTGRHVVVDKPAFLGRRESEALLELADRQGVCLAEATVFAYHPQLALVQEQFTALGDHPTRLNVTLSFPPMDPGNFRYRAEQGGGAVWDLGPYAVAVGRVFFGGEPGQVAAQILTRRGTNGVDTAFSYASNYGGGRSVVGHFGFDTVYRNRLDAIGAEVGVDLDRFFTTVPEAANELRITTREGTRSLTGPSGDSFANFFSHVFTSIEARDWTQLASDLLTDARVLDRLRRATGVLVRNETRPPLSYPHWSGRPT